MNLPLICDSAMSCMVNMTLEGDCNEGMIESWFDDLKEMGVEIPTIAAPKDYVYLIQGSSGSTTLDCGMITVLLRSREG